MTAHSVQVGTDRTTELVAELRTTHGMTTETRHAGLRVIVTGHGRSLTVARVRGWWVYERPTTGPAPVRERIHPEGMEVTTARAVASMLSNGAGVAT